MMKAGLFKEFCDQTSIHGFKYLNLRSSSVLEKYKESEMPEGDKFV